MSSIKQWAARASSYSRKGGEIALNAGEEGDEDFASELVLPDGPLQLHIRPKTSSSSHRSRAESTSASSTSGGSALFSDSEHGSSRSKRTDVEDEILRDAADVGDAEDVEDDDERSNTLKANQLPDSFAAQLAASKAQAALARQIAQHAGKVHHLGSKTLSSPEQSMDWDEDIQGLQSARLARPVVRKASFTSHISDSEGENEIPSSLAIPRDRSTASRTHVKPSRTSHHDDDDIESDFELPESVQKVRLSASSTARRLPSAIELQRVSSPALDTSASSAEHRRAKRASASLQQSSGSSKSHARSATSMSQASSAGKASNEDHEDFFDDIVLPSYFGKKVDDDVTPPSSIDSSVAKKVDLQAILKEKMAGKAGIAKMAERQAGIAGTTLKSSSGSVASTNSQVSGAKGVARSKYSEKPGDDFEDGLIIDEPSDLVRPTIAEHGSPNKFGLGSSSPPSRGTHVAPAGRSSLKSARSTLGLNALSSNPTTPVGLPRLASGTSNSDRTHTLRSKPSLSNLSNRTISPGPSIAAPTLGRRKSSAFLAATAASDALRPPSPAYAQPTRSFLARQQTSPADSYPSMAGVALSQQLHLRSNAGHGSRPGTPVSPGVGQAFSRLTQPTLASRAKSRTLSSAASDPSGRTSASLGQPIPSTSSSSSAGISAIPLARNLRQPSSLRRAQQFGDGTELDAFDDLPINKEKEKRFLKAPRRRQSSGAATEVDRAVNPAGPGGKGKSVSKIQRDRIEFAPMKLQHTKRRGQNASGGSTASTVVDPHAKAARVSVESSRPKLQLIKGLNAAKLSKVQGEMKWNPVSMRWEGNEASLRDFDNVLASSSRPALISPIFGPMSPRHMFTKSPLSTPPAGTANTSSGPVNTQLSGVRIVGDMIFDPVRMSWFTTSAEGENEIDFGDDEADTSMSSTANGPGGEPVVDAWEGGENMRLKTRRSFANDWGSNASEAGDGLDDPEVAKALFEAIKQKTIAAQKTNDEEMRSWRNLRSRRSSADRSYLYAINRLVRDE